MRDTRSQWPNPLTLLSHSFSLWGKNFVYLLGLAVVGTVFTVASAFIIGLVIRALGGSESLPEPVEFMLTIFPMILAHAGFMVIVSQITAQKAGVQTGRMSFGVWLGNSLVIAVLIAVVLAPFSIWAPRLSVMALMVVISLTPLLSGLVLRGWPRNISLWGQFVVLAFFAALPWFAIAEFFGLPSQVADSWGIMDGGIVLIPLTAIHTFLASTSSAIVSTVVFVSLIPRTLPASSLT